MSKSSRWNRFRCGLLLCATAIALPAQTFTTLASFNGPNGVQPVGALVQGTDGNLYGATVAGGVHGSGAVFRTTPGGTLTTLYSFCTLTNCADGEYPEAGLIQASDGNFYGTTFFGYGTVFKITPGGMLTTLRIFQDGADGLIP